MEDAIGSTNCGSMPIVSYLRLNQHAVCIVSCVRVLIDSAHVEQIDDERSTLIGDQQRIESIANMTIGLTKEKTQTQRLLSFNGQST